MGKLNKLILKAYEKGYRVDKKGNVIGLRKKILSKKVINPNGYHYFSFRDGKKREIVLTHRLQAFQKYGEKLFEKDVLVRHLDGNPLNNSWGNIAIGTQSDNMMDKPKKQRRFDASNPKHNHKEILRDREKGLTYTELMNKYNISSKGTVSFIINKSLQKGR